MKYTEERGRQYMGQISRAYMAYAGDEQVRIGAGSGGAVSALLLYLLDTGEIDAAIVTKIKCSEEGISCKVILARDRQAILSARTSKYIDVPLARDAVRLLKDFSGKAAVVALPCHTTVLRKLMAKDPVLASKIKYIIALFCIHSCEKYLLDGVLRKHKIEQSKVTDFAFKRGWWRGRMEGTLADGSKFSFPSSCFSRYHNLNFFCLGRCLRCHDHTGYEADFSAGDAWIREMKAEPVKHTIILARNEPAAKILDDMTGQGKLTGKPVDDATIFRAQRRSLIYHYNVSARSRVGKWYGVAIKDTVNTKVRWNDCLAAHIIMINYKLSRSKRWRDLIFNIPRPIIFLYFLFLKFLQNF